MAFQPLNDAHAVFDSGDGVVFTRAEVVSVIKQKVHFYRVRPRVENYAPVNLGCFLTLTFFGHFLIVSAQSVKVSIAF